jgi:precorrin-4 methylase
VDKFNCSCHVAAAHLQRQLATPNEISFIALAAISQRIQTMPHLWSIKFLVAYNLSLHHLVINMVRASAEDADKDLHKREVSSMTLTK